MAISVTGIKDNIVVASHHVSSEPSVTSFSTMKGAFFASGIFHIGVVIISMIGIPFLVKEQPLIITPVSVELVNIADITQTPKIASPKKIEEPKEIKKPVKPEPIEEKPKPEPVKKDPPPPPPSEVKKDPPKPDPIPEPKAEPKKKPEKPKEKPKEVVKEEPQEDKFESLLKNLSLDDIKPKEQSETSNEKPLEEILDETTSGQIANLADQLTVSELDAFKRQLEPCWNIPSGAKFAENLAVEVRANLSPDGSVNSATVLDKGRYNRDSAYRAAADSALRALRNPRCTPLQLPADKYQQWKTIVINFDPQDML